MTIFFFALASALAATEPPRTLPFETFATPEGRVLRPLPECQWLARDFVEGGKPTLDNTAHAGRVLRVRPSVEIPVLGEAGEIVWHGAERLTAYADRGILERYAEVGQRHGRRKFFYETAHNARRVVASGAGFPLEPGDLVVTIGDASLLRMIDGLPVVEFRLLEATEIDGQEVFRPTVRRGVLPIEVIARSTELVYGDCAPALESFGPGKI